MSSDTFFQSKLAGARRFRDITGEEVGQTKRTMDAKDSRRYRIMRRGRFAHFLLEQVNLKVIDRTSRVRVKAIKMHKKK